MAIHIAGYLFPMSTTWGFHFLGFLSPWYFIAFLAFCSAALVYYRSDFLGHHLEQCAAFMEKNPVRFIAAVIVLFACSSYVLRQDIFLLGDNFVYINNYENTLNGTHPLRPTHEPLSIYYFLAVIKLMGTVKFPEMLDAMLAGEILLGAGLIINTFIIVRTSRMDRIEQLIVFSFLLTMPFMQVFFGYPESYSFALFSLSCFLTISILFLRDKLSFLFVPLIYLGLLFAHYLNAILFPALLYLAALEYRKRGIKQLIIGAVCSTLVLLSILIAVEFDFNRLYPRMAHAHYLSLTNVQDGFQAYTLFSTDHFIDLINYLILLAPSSACLFTFIFLKRKAFRSVASDEERFLMIGASAVVLVVFSMKFDLGLARDWDVAAPLSYLVGLFVILSAIRIVRPVGMAALALIVLAAALNSLVWFTFNSTKTPGINRATAIMDPRFIGPEGVYAATFHLSMAYHTIGDTGSMATLWRGYLRDHPGDMRAYPHLIRSYMAVGNTGPEQIIATYDEWLAREPGSVKARSEYADFCINVGNVYFDRERIDGAKYFYEKALKLNPKSPQAYNNLASVYHRLGEYATAISLYQIAISTDSTYVDSYLNLGRTYFDNGEIERSIEVLKPAARLGDSTAQAYLRKNHLTW